MLLYGSTNLHTIFSPLLMENFYCMSQLGWLMSLTSPISTAMWVDAMFDIEVFNTSQMLIWPSISSFFGFGHFTKMCFAKFPTWTFIVKASPKIVCHKIQWLQFANKGIGGFQSWHFSKHFQIPTTLAISTLQLWLGTDCNFDLASTAICECGFSKQNWVKSDRKSWLKLETFGCIDASVIMRSFGGEYGLG